MQGTVWGGLMCTNTMDDLPKSGMKEEDIKYKYRCKVSVPPLEMVDNIITIAECGNKSVKLNAIVNAFIEQKKLVLSAKKMLKYSYWKQSI